MTAANDWEIAWAGVTIDCTNPETTAQFWAELLGHHSRRAGADRPGCYRIGPFVDGGPVLNFQPVTEPNRTKVRLHLDLWVEDLDAAVRRTRALGGRVVGESQIVAGRGTITVMADPEGHEFCLIAAPRLAPAARVMGRRS